MYRASSDLSQPTCPGSGFCSRSTGLAGRLRAYARKLGIRATRRVFLGLGDRQESEGHCGVPRIRTRRLANAENSLTRSRAARADGAVVWVRNRRSEQLACMECDLMHPGTLTTATAANLAFTFKLFSKCKYTEAQLLFEATLEVQLVRHRLGFIGIRGLRPMSGNLKTARLLKTEQVLFAGPGLG